VERRPRPVPIQRDGDVHVTCHVLATALTPSSASVTADYRRNGPSACGPVPGAVSRGPEGKRASSFVLR